MFRAHPSHFGCYARAALAGFTFLAGASAAALPEFQVALKPDLVPDPSYEVVFLKRLVSEDTPAAPGAPRIYSTELSIREGVRMRVGTIERDGREPLWFADKNLDGEFSPDERFTLSYEPTTIRIPLKNAPFQTFPVNLKTIKLPEKDAEGLRKQDVRPLFFSMAAALTCDLEIDGATTPFFFRWNAETMNIDLTNTWIGADVDRDGLVDTKQGNIESVYTRKDKPVFRVGSRYFRAAQIDQASLTAVLQEVPESEYKLILLRAGVTVPDFSYTGFDRKTHSLKERKSKYTMLYFWATWCAFCLTEMPFMNEAHTLYPDSDLRLIGLNRDEDVETARKYIGQKHIDWEQAQFPSVEDLLLSRMRIEDYPTAILLDHSYKIVSMDERGQLPIRNEGLLPALEKLLGKPAPTHSPSAQPR